MKPIEFRGKETMSYNKTEQPTAEGAEEITAEEFIREKIRQKFYVKGEMLGLWTYLCNGEDALRLVHEFATLHAQRIAEKMVSERLIEFGEMIRDEPNGDIAALAEYFIRTINLKSRK